MVDQSVAAGRSAGAMAAEAAAADSPKHGPKTSCKKTAASTTVGESAACDNATAGDGNTDDDGGQPEPQSLNHAVVIANKAANGAAPCSSPTVDAHQATNTVGAADSTLEAGETSRGTTTPQSSPTAGTANVNGQGHSTQDTSMLLPPLHVSPPRTPTTLPTGTFVGASTNTPTPTPTPRHATTPKAGIDKSTPAIPTSTTRTTGGVPAIPTIPQPIRLVSYDSSQDYGNCG